MAIDQRHYNDLAERIARDVVAIRSEQSSTLVSMPILYPSGSSVVIEVSNYGDDYFITDMGMGHQEADMMGGSRIFTQTAKVVAENSGVGFDRHAFFVAKASQSQVVGAVIAVANCSGDATTITAHKLTEKTHADNAEILYRRLVSVFSKRVVVKDYEVMGASETSWHVAASVKTDGNVILFDAVSKHANSIASAVTKFGDISQLDHPPRRVAVVENKQQFGTKLAVLSRTADVIELNVPDRRFKQLAEAA